MEDLYKKSYNSEAVEKEFGCGFKGGLAEAKAIFIKNFGELNEFKGAGNTVDDSLSRGQEEDAALIAFGFCHVCAGNGNHWISCCGDRRCPCQSTGQAFFGECGYCNGTGFCGQKQNKEKWEATIKAQFEMSQKAIKQSYLQDQEKEQRLRYEEENSFGDSPLIFKTKE
jgi:hypothetical protein